MTDNLVNDTQNKAKTEKEEIQKEELPTQGETASVKEKGELAEATSVTEQSELVSSQIAQAEAESPNEIDFGAILMEYEQEQQAAFGRGKVVTGKVIGFTDKAMMVDFGHKSEGIVDINEVKKPNGELKLKEGDEIEVVIRHIDSSDNPPILSYLDAVRRRAWGEILTAYKNKQPIKCQVVERVKGGLKVDLNGVEAFLPASLVDSYPVNINPFVGKEIEVKVIKCNRKKNNVIVSRKAITDEVIKRQKEAFFSQIAEGYVVEGTVKSVLDYGVFVDIGGIDGLLHLSEISWEKLEHPSKLFNVGDKIQVKIVEINRKKEKVSLSYKQLLPDPWDIVPEKYPVGATVKGKVSSILDYGAFVELEPGVEGLIHVSEMTWSKNPKHPKKIVNIGKEIQVKVIDVDPSKRRLSLSMKSLIPNPWHSVEEKYPVGTTVKGIVRGLTNFGAFVELEDGIDGFVHISEITWKKIKHPREVLKKKQKVEAKVIGIDHRRERLSLSIKALQPSAWDLFIQNHRPGDIVRGKISRFTNFGVFVRLAEDLEGLCHISELSEEKVESPDKVVKIGDELDFRILRIEPDTQKIGLSHRAVTSKVEEKELEKKVYVNTEAKGALTSLGELLITKLGSEAKNLIPVEKEEQSKDQQKDESVAAQKEASDEMKEAEKVEDTEAVEESKEKEISTSDDRENQKEEGILEEQNLEEPKEEKFELQEKVEESEQVSEVSLEAADSETSREEVRAETSEQERLESAVQGNSQEDSQQLKESESENSQEREEERN